MALMFSIPLILALTLKCLFQLTCHWHIEWIIFSIAALLKLCCKWPQQSLLNSLKIAIGCAFLLQTFINLYIFPLSTVTTSEIVVLRDVQICLCPKEWNDVVPFHLHKCHKAVHCSILDFNLRCSSPWRDLYSCHHVHCCRLCPPVQQWQVNMLLCTVVLNSLRSQSLNSSQIAMIICSLLQHDSVSQQQFYFKIELCCNDKVIMIW